MMPCQVSSHEKPNIMNIILVLCIGCMLLTINRKGVGMHETQPLTPQRVVVLLLLLHRWWQQAIADMIIFIHMMKMIYREGTAAPATVMVGSIGQGNDDTMSLYEPISWLFLFYYLLPVASDSDFGWLRYTIARDTATSTCQNFAKQNTTGYSVRCNRFAFELVN